MRPEMKYTRNKILLRHEEESIYVTYHCGRNEMKFLFRVGRSETAHQKI